MSDETANAVRTIEEAWAAFEKELAVYDYLGPFAKDTVDAARALALASAAAMLPPRGHKAPKTAIERRYLVVKAQIEALGE